MEESGSEFPGFQTCVHKDELEYKGPLSRLQRRAPYSLQITPNASLEICKGAPKAIMGGNINSSASSSSSSLEPSSSFDSFYHSKDPIPLLSPLVLPSLLESACIQQGNTVKSH